MTKTVVCSLYRSSRSEMRGGNFFLGGGEDREREKWKGFSLLKAFGERERERERNFEELDAVGSGGYGKAHKKQNKSPSRANENPRASSEKKDRF